MRGPTPAGPAPGDERVYDAAGRVVASRVGADPWSCVTYDARGRVTSRNVAALGNEAARSVSYNYAVGDNPLVTSLSEAAGTMTITTTVDLLGRTVAYKDVTPFPVLTDTTTTVPRVLLDGSTTTSTYDQAGRLWKSDGPAGLQETTYDDAGRPELQKLDNSSWPIPPTTPPGNCKPSATHRGPATGATPHRCQPSAVTRPGAPLPSPGPWRAGHRSATR